MIRAKVPKISKCIILVIASLCILVFPACHQTHQEKDHPEYFDEVLTQTKRMIESGSPEEALAYIDSSYAAFNSPSKYDRFRKYNLKTNYYMVIAIDYTRASLCADSMIDMLKEDPEAHRADYTYSLNTKGLILFNQRKFTEAFGYIYSAKTFAKTSADSCSFASFSSGLGLILFQQQKYGDAMKYFQTAYEESALCDQNDIIKSFDLRQGYLDNIALCYERLGKLDSAVIYYRKALDFIAQNEKRYPVQKVSIESNRGIIYGNLGGTYFKEGKMKEAEDMLKEGLFLNRQKGHENRDAHYTGIKLANVYLATGRFKEAFTTMMEVRKSLDSLPVSEAELRWRRLAWKYYDTLGNIEKAYAFHRQYTDFKDSLDASKKELAGADFNKAFESISQEYQIALLTADNKLKTNYLILAVIISLMAVMILFLILKNYRQSKQNVLQLEDLNKKVYEQNLHLQGTMHALQQSQEDNSRMMRVVVHDLRNPISGIVSLTEIMLEEGHNTKSQIEMLDMIKTSGTSALQFVGDILQANAKSDEMVKEMVDLCEVISDSVALMQVRAKDKHQQVWLQAESVPAMINREKIWRVINNLLFNAIKFSAENTRVDVVLKRIGNIASLSIKDQGIGIPPEIKDKIFDAFSLAKRTGTSGEQSFGLGLSISKQIIEAHGGKIWFDTCPGKGTTFNIELPIL